MGNLTRTASKLHGQKDILCSQSRSFKNFLKLWQDLNLVLQMRLQKLSGHLLFGWHCCLEICCAEKWKVTVRYVFGVLGRFSYWSTKRQMNTQKFSQETSSFRDAVANTADRCICLCVVPIFMTGFSFVRVKLIMVAWSLWSVSISFFVLSRLAHLTLYDTSFSDTIFVIL